MRKSALLFLLLCPLFGSDVIETESVPVDITDNESNSYIKFSEFLKKYYDTNKVPVGVKEFVLVDGTTNTVLLCNHEKSKMFPSSMTKMITLYILFDYIASGKIGLDSVFTVSEHAHQQQGSKMFLASGEKVEVNDLINGIAIVSGNDAAMTVAENIAGSEEGFKVLMDEYIAKLGLKNTLFQNCTGWPHEEHYSSACDILVLAMRLWRDFPQFNRRFSQTKFEHNNIKQNTYNDLLLHHKNIDGIKTGHTEAGGYGIAITYRCVTNPARRLFIVVNGAKNEKERREDVFRLLSFAERTFGNYQLFQKGRSIKSIPVLNGVEKSVGVVLNDDVVLSLDKGSLSKIKCTVTYNHPINSVVKGEKIAVLSVKIGSAEKKYDLYADRTIREASIFTRFYNNIRYILFGKV